MAEPCFCIPVLPVLVHAIPCIFSAGCGRDRHNWVDSPDNAAVINCCTVYTEYKYKKKEDVNYRILQGTLLTSIFGMFLHSCLDFDLSISSVFLLLWTLMALFNSGYRHIGLL